MSTFIAMPDTAPVAGYNRPRIGKMLDFVPVFAAYGLHKMRRRYTGPAIRVRRSSDNTVKDIGFTAKGALDETALLAFVGAGSGYVQTYYDQGEQGRNLTDGPLIASGYTNAIQPRIVNAGVIERIGTYPCLTFQGAQLLTSAAGAAFVAMGGQTSIALVQVPVQAATSRVLGITGSAGTNPHFDPLGFVGGSSDAVFHFQSADVSHLLRAPGAATDTPKVLTSVDTGTTVTMRVDGAPVAKLDPYARTNTGAPFSRFSLGGTHSGPSNTTSARSMMTGRLGPVIIVDPSEDDFAFLEPALLRLPTN